MKSRKQGVRVSEGITKFIEEKLKLKVNRGKTSVTGATKIKYLGFSFYIASGKKVCIRAHPKSIEKMKRKIRELTKRNNGWGYEKLKVKLTQFIRGWVNYFKIADMKSMVKNCDGWLRRKIRCYIWKSWKTVKGKYRNLRKVGLSHNEAMKISNTRKGYWRISKCREINIAITNERLRKAGYATFQQYYSPATE